MLNAQFQHCKDARLYAPQGVEKEYGTNRPNDLGVNCTVYRALDIDLKPYLYLYLYSIALYSYSLSLVLYCPL